MHISHAGSEYALHFSSRFLSCRVPSTRWVSTGLCPERRSTQDTPFLSVCTTSGHRGSLARRLGSPLFSGCLRSHFPAFSALGVGGWGFGSVYVERKPVLTYLRCFFPFFSFGFILVFSE